MNIPLKKLIEIAFVFATVGYITVGVLDYSFRKAAISIEEYYRHRKWENSREEYLQLFDQQNSLMRKQDSLFQKRYTGEKNYTVEQLILDQQLDSKLEYEIDSIQSLIDEILK